MRPKGKTLLYGLGALAAIIGGGWALYTLWHQADATQWSAFLVENWLLLIGLASLQCIASALLALAWGTLLPGLGARRNLRHEDIWSHSTSQAGKYIPGNIAHLAARHALGRESGLAHGELIRATIAEALSLILAALFVALLSGFAHHLPMFQTSHPLWAMLPPTAAIGLLFWQWRSGRPIRLIWLGVGFVGHVGFFALTGFSLWLLADLLTAAPLSIVGVAAVAWMLGFLTPGAPGGLGVREAVMLGLLSLSIAGTDWALIVLIHRALTILGDLALAGGAALWRPHRNLGDPTPD